MKRFYSNVGSLRPRFKSDQKFSIAVYMHTPTHIRLALVDYFVDEPRMQEIVAYRVICVESWNQILRS